jgi:hypothetical protein
MNPDRLIFTATVSIHLDKLLVETLSDEIALAITEQAKKDLRSSAAVKKQIAKAATTKLLTMLGVPAEEPIRKATQPTMKEEAKDGQ